ncbi:thiamine-phosphate pyrophosphorylase [Maritimibacter alkaliphilus HTCC2654]|uniref:Thiamine-phosphate pyrophosphorylase, putative n=1 Tax=Maritimibacter alkaliphilus HTCC2654 TaxID=314271 RepID=A3VKD6_9RHOB|nr:thiamine phosphate synthase [Maritimibacter alkaliphilus]EAQ11260.1 thiamine-phosphate pyrophosphorylase, putative [Maritimibacter alkaliphilus HTCC2654]TYP81479.1 thiamine-phosphate pyrophosphorylase [Maritimibacter alkaliphilus HTCC2654]
MAETDLPQLYLVTPPQFELSSFPDQLARALDAVEIACLRLELATRDEDTIARAADACREVAHARDIAIVIADHVLMVERLGLDGVHFTDGSRQVRKTRKDLGKDAIVGAFCGTSRHDGMTAGEQDADYVAFGPVGTSNLGTGEIAGRDLFQWWTEMIEVPIVAEGGLTEALVRDFAPVTDFFSFGEEIWTAEDPTAALTALAAARA